MGLWETGRRFLEEVVEEDVPSVAPTPAPTTAISKLGMAEILRTTLRLYGSLFFLLMVVFCIVRRRYPKAFNVRNSVAELNSPLSESIHGWISWMWKVFANSDSEMFQYCGMDAIAYIRILRFGLKLTLVGSFNAIFLIPTYLAGGLKCDDFDDDCQEKEVKDRIEKIGLGNLPSQSHSLLAVTVASYIFFGAAMYLLLKEFEWFTENRHKFLAQPRPENYTVYVSGIPPQYRSNRALLRYFQDVFHQQGVLEANVALKIPDLEKAVTKRAALVANLEHAINIRDIKGEAPTHRNLTQLGERIDSISAYTEELSEMNESIPKMIDDIKEKSRDPEDTATARRTTSSTAHGTQDELEVRVVDSRNDEGIETQGEHRANEEEAAGIETQGEHRANEEEAAGHHLGLHEMVKGTMERAADAGTALTSTAQNVFFGGEDGDPRDAGFVSFRNLTAKAQALQIVHHGTPYALLIQRAPTPKDIFWANVGTPHKSRQAGVVMSMALTVLLCFFWTIPVAFVSSFAEVSELKKTLPFLQRWTEEWPQLEPALAQVKPILTIVLRALVPPILLQFAKLEGHIGEGSLQASLFGKLSAFYIVQLFFVAAISGSIWARLQSMIDRPFLIVNLLASSLPAQAGGFMQYILVETFLGLVIEILRFIPLAIAAIRSRIGPNLTDKERNKIHMGLRPLSIPPKFAYAQTLSRQALYFVILMVYSTSAPITCIVMGFCFLMLLMVYQNQFIYIYSPHDDTGGELWAQFIRIAISGMLIAQLTIFGVLGLKEGYIAGPLVFPLFVLTIGFSIYVHQQHLRVTHHLPSLDCAIEDQKNEEEGFDYDFVASEYIQPALKVRELHPDTSDDAEPATAQQAQETIQEVATPEQA